MIGYIFAWLAYNWPLVLFWSVFAGALVCCVVGGYLTWRDWSAQEASE